MSGVDLHVAYHMSRGIFAAILRVFFRMRVRGKEHIPREGPFILASNHVSYLDPPVLGVACPRKLSYMARHDLFSSSFASWWLYAVGCFPVKRGSGDIAAFKTAIRKLNEGEALLVFPEGGRQAQGTALKEPEPGIGMLASRLGVPVIPAFVSGTEKALPKGARSILPSKIFVYFGKQINIERGSPYQNAANLIMERIRRLACS